MFCGFTDDEMKKQKKRIILLMTITIALALIIIAAAVYAISSLFCIYENGPDGIVQPLTVIAAICIVYYGIRCQIDEAAVVIRLMYWQHCYRQWKNDPAVHHNTDKWEEMLVEQAKALPLNNV